MGKTYKKGLAMALLFSLGLIITLTFYGVAVALAGQALGLAQVAQIMYIIAGVMSFVFGLSELKLIKLDIPAYRGMPGFIQEQSDYLKAFFMGLFLGNAGIGCPNPATYVILTWIAGSGDVVLGAGLQAVNGLGRALPLIALSILAILGVNATQALMKKKVTISKATGWGLIFFGALIIVWGLFGHFWFLNTPVHEGWDVLAASFSGKAAEYSCCIEPACKMCSERKWIWEDGSCRCRQAYANGEFENVCPECLKGIDEGKSVFALAERTQVPAFSLLAALIAIPIVWYYWKKPFSKVKT
jgi:cytochrome c-type biogenesis protein